jgi:hypothetical protein
VKRILNVIKMHGTTIKIKRQTDRHVAHSTQTRKSIKFYSEKVKERHERRNQELINLKYVP